MRTICGGGAVGKGVAGPRHAFERLTSEGAFLASAFSGPRSYIASSQLTITREVL